MITRNAPRIPLFAPGVFQGLGWRHPYYTQGLRHIQTLLQASVSCSQTGALLCHTAEAFRVELRVPFSLGRTSYQRYSSYVPRSWYKSTWEFADTHELQVHKDYPNPPLLRAGDTYIMDAFINGGFSGRDLRVLNQIRLRLHVISVADISCPDGATIRCASFMTESGNGFRDHLTWPGPVPLTPRLVTLWQRAIASSLLCPGTTTRQLCPCYAAGDWFDPDLLSD